MTWLFMALKLEKDMEMMTHMGWKEGATGELQSDEDYCAGYLAMPAASTSSLALHDMIAATDNSQPQKELSSPQPELREPVLV